jgi:hypothetical protein
VDAMPAGLAGQRQEGIIGQFSVGA